MTDQLRISDSGDIESQPVTWDGEPVYCADTVREGLFDPAAFEQIAGQTALETDGIDNSPETVEARRDMFRGFGWSVS